MVKYSVNAAAVEKATALVDDGQYVVHSDWSKVRPTAEQENEFVRQHGWDAFAHWHLAIDDEHHNAHAKNHYGFPFGDFHKVHRQALVAAVDRAGEWHHEAVESAAHAVLKHLDAAESHRDS